MFDLRFLYGLDTINHNVQSHKVLVFAFSKRFYTITRLVRMEFFDSKRRYIMDNQNQFISFVVVQLMVQIKSVLRL